MDTIRGHRLFVDRPRQDDRIRVVINQLRDAKHEFYNAQTAAKKRRFRFAIYQAFAELAQHELSWMKQHQGLGLDDSSEIRARLAELQKAERALGQVREELDRARKLKRPPNKKTPWNVSVSGGRIRKPPRLFGISTSPRCFTAPRKLIAKAIF